MGADHDVSRGRMSVGSIRMRSRTYVWVFQIVRSFVVFFQVMILMYSCFVVAVVIHHSGRGTFDDLVGSFALSTRIRMHFKESSEKVK